MFRITELSVKVEDEVFDDPVYHDRNTTHLSANQDKTQQRLDKKLIRQTVDEIINGKLKVDIGETPDLVIEQEAGMCQKARYTEAFHINAIDGQMKIKLKEENEEGLIVVAFLQRENTMYSNIPFNTICNKHKDRSQEDIQKHVVQDNDNMTKYLDADEHSTFPALYKTLTPSGINVRFMCFDSCMTHENIKIKEAARNMILNLLIVDVTHPTKLFPKKLYKISVWPKALVNNRDLLKKVRREKKGGMVKAKNPKLVPRKDLRAMRKSAISIAYKSNMTLKQVNEQYLEFCEKVRSNGKGRLK